MPLYVKDRSEDFVVGAAAGVRQDVMGKEEWCPITGGDKGPGASLV